MEATSSTATHDLEKTQSKGSNVSNSSSTDVQQPYSEPKQGLMRTFFNTFKELEPSKEDADLLKNPDLSEAERREIALKNTPLQRGLKARHLQMIALGGSIGTGLFIGSGSSLRTGGAASLSICWTIVGVLAFSTIHALGELTTAYPVSGAFSAHSTKFIEPSFGFAVGWNYAIFWMVVLPAEIIAASLTLQFWNDTINPVAWVTIFYVFVMSINLFGVRGYGEAEYIFTMIKMVAIIGFLILGIVLVCGGGPTHGFVGGMYYRNPGPFTHGFKGVCTVFITAAYSLGGSELIGVTGAEAANPRKTLPSAIKQVFWRIMLFYLGSLTLISLLVNSEDKRLLGTSSADAEASPFVIAIKNGGIKVLPSIMNAVILISVLSVGNSAVFGCSRTLASLAAQGLAPKFFNYIDRMGRPIFGIAANGVVGLLCYCVASKHESTVFAWLMSLCGLAIVLTWFSICVSHIRFRLAMKVQGRSLDELAFKSQAGFWGSVFCSVILVLVLCLQFWVSLYPIGAEKPDVTNFFQNYLGAFIFLGFYVARKLYIRKLWEFTPLNEIKLDAGRSAVDIDLMHQEIAEERALLASKGFLYRTYKFWC